jgi:hypothetical protein
MGRADKGAVGSLKGTLGERELARRRADQARTDLNS